MGELLLGEFAGPEPLLEAARELRKAGLRRLEAYSPYPLEGACEALGAKRSRVPLVVLLSALAGAAGAYALQYLTNAVDWPLIVGNRPPHAAPSFVPITFELAVLFGAFGAFFAFLGFNRLPMLYHRAEEVEQFRNATVSGFWLSLERDGSDPPAERLVERLRALGATRVSVVEERRP